MKKIVVNLIVIIILISPLTAFADWSVPVRISEPGGCLYPQITAQGDTLHVVYNNNSGGDKISYIRSSDGGQTWSEHQVLSDTISWNHAVFPIIIPYESNLIVLWRDSAVSGLRRRNIGYAVSHDNGFTWTEPAYICNRNWYHILYFASSGQDSVINVIFNSQINNNDDLFFYNVRSTDFGSSWSDTVQLFMAAESGRMDMVSHNNYYHYVWYGDFVDTTYWETYYIRSTDAGLTWSDNISLTVIDNYNSYWPSLAVNGDSGVVLCWTDFKYSPSPFSGDLFIRCSYDNGEDWDQEQQVTFTHRAMYPDICWHNDSMQIAWMDTRFNHQDIFYKGSTDNGFTWSEDYRLESDPHDSRWPAVASSNGRVHVIWADGREGYGVYYSRYESSVGIGEEYNKPDRCILFGAYPNPFNSSTVINYSNIEGGEIKIYDITGRLIRTLDCGGSKKGKITWDARDAVGNKVSSGIYFARAQTPQGLMTLKLTYLK